MSLFYGFYFGVIAFAAVLSFIAYKKGDTKSLFILLILVATLFAEIATLIFKDHKILTSGFILFIFNLMEYTLFCTYYLKSSKNSKFKFGVKLSIPLFIAFGICTWYLKYHFNRPPVLNIDVEGFLLIIIYTHLLFNLDAAENKAIHIQPNFWIAIGILIFYGGVFVFVVSYPILRKIDPEKARIEYEYIFRSLNIFFYICIIIGLICAIRTKKYLPL
ncbi:MAG TPA: hypothetical protein VGC01_08575 [Mucilaginibacter sp.]